MLFLWNSKGFSRGLEVDLWCRFILFPPLFFFPRQLLRGKKTNIIPFIFLTCHHVCQNLHSQEAPAALRRDRVPERDQPALPQQEHQWAAGQDPAQSERGSLRSSQRLQAGQLSSQRWRTWRTGRGGERQRLKEVRLWDTCASPHRPQSEVSTGVAHAWMICCL